MPAEVTVQVDVCHGEGFFGAACVMREDQLLRIGGHWLERGTYRRRTSPSKARKALMSPLETCKGSSQMSE